MKKGFYSRTWDELQNLSISNRLNSIRLRTGRQETKFFNITFKPITPIYSDLNLHAPPVFNFAHVSKHGSTQECYAVLFNKIPLRITNMNILR